MIIDKINRKPPTRLYHYTNLESIVGIISSQELWLSNLYFQNDKNEYEIGLNILKKVLQHYKLVNIDNIKNSIFFKSLDSALDFLTKKQIYTTSLSEEPDLFSQWRGYGDNCRGARLEFLNLEKIKKKGIQLLPCIYNKDEQEEYVEFLFERSIEILNSTEEKGMTNKEDFSEDEKPYSDAIQAAGSYFISAFNVACAIIKDEAFREEKEWRIINFRGKEVFYRVKSHYIVPFVKMKIDHLHEYFTDIMLCASPEYNISERSVRFLLDQQGFNETTISQSKIPYRL